MTKLIMSDIDGTLMNVGKTTDEITEKELSDEILKTIDKLKKAGYIFGVASGRQYPGVKKLFEPVFDGLVFSCENGSIIIKDDKVISQTVIPRETANELIEDIMKDYPNSQPLISGKMVSYLIKPTAEYHKIISEYLGNITVVVNSLDEIKEDIQKVAIYRTPVFDIADKFAEKWSNRLNVAIAGDTWLDFTLCDKGDGVKKLCELLNISPDDVVVFGDNFNDIPMFKVAGTSYAMSTANEAVKAYATGTCDSVSEKCKELFKL